MPPGYWGHNIILRSLCRIDVDILEKDGKTAGFDAIFMRSLAYGRMRTASSANSVLSSIGRAFSILVSRLGNTKV